MEVDDDDDPRRSSLVYGIEPYDLEHNGDYDEPAENLKERMAKSSS